MMIYYFDLLKWFSKMIFQNDLPQWFAKLDNSQTRQYHVWDSYYKYKRNNFFWFAFSLPWDQRTLHGWIALNIFSFFAASFYLIIDYSFLAFFIGICEHHYAFFKSFGASVRQLDEHSGSNVIETKAKLVKLIHFHILARK